MFCLFGNCCLVSLVTVSHELVGNCLDGVSCDLVQPRGTSRHEALKERARQLLEAARRDTAAQAASSDSAAHQSAALTNTLSRSLSKVSCSSHSQRQKVM